MLASRSLQIATLGFLAIASFAAASSFSVHRTTAAFPDSKRTIPIMTEFGEVFYYVSIHVGNPPQHMLVTLDTGSSLIGLPTTKCAACPQAEKYNMSDTSSIMISECSDVSQCYSRTCGMSPSRCRCANSTTCATTTRYSDGSFWNATIVYDDVKLGGFWVRAPIGAISSASPTMFRAPSEGIIGMSLTSEWLNGLFKQHPQLDPVWSICIGADGGQMSLGTLDPNLFEGQIQWTPFAKPENPFYYSVQLKSIEIYPKSEPKLGQVVAVPKKWVDSGSVLVDTGASHIFVDPDIFEGLKTAMKFVCLSGRFDWIGFCLLNEKGEGFFESYRYDNLTSEQLEDLPIFSLEFENNVVVELSWKEYLIQRVYAGGVTTYFLGFLPGSPNEINLGDPFIRSSFLAFDFKNSAMGVATKTSACD